MVLVSVDEIAVRSDFPFFTGEHLNVPKLGHGHTKLVVENVGLGGKGRDDG